MRLQDAGQPILALRGLDITGSSTNRGDFIVTNGVYRGDGSGLTNVPARGFSFTGSPGFIVTPTATASGTNFQGVLAAVLTNQIQAPPPTNLLAGSPGSISGQILTIVGASVAAGTNTTVATNATSTNIV